MTNRSAIGNRKSTIPRPLLKWAGGKRQLLPQLRRFYPPEFNRYIEPFFGSGAVFFDLHALGRMRDREAILIDSNADLIGCYEDGRDNPEGVAAALDELAAAHARDGQAHYYDLRDARFNPMRDAARGGDGRIAYTPQLAAMLIYLNRTGFNGLFRLNSRGEFNVPAGRYDRPRICDRPRLQRVADALRAPGVQLVLGTFEAALDFARAGDFLYFDPPYAPLSRTANFTAYTASGFTSADQARLQQTVVELAGRGCAVLLSNSTAENVVALYEQEDTKAAGLYTLTVPARRAINRDPARRGSVDELIVTNVRM